MMDQFSNDPNIYTAEDEATAQRGGARDSLFLSARLVLPALAAPVTVRVRNLSPGGLMAEYSGRASIGDAVEVEVRGIGAIAGQVAWITEGRLGIAFETEVDPLRARKPVAVPPRPQPPKRKRAVL
ncbi:PilZ domain-containing protein [Sphingomonas sp.]|uniref:PilZ domain-containing protein n=1 Tax=Sphingomonas sp. TaxID=28214 RepID=UPI002DD6AEDE|nr:PilZ domain-containing protein [Sphingomonas sp.]